jgi:recombination protein RecA
MRAQAALLKRDIEAKLAHRIPAALSPIAQQAPRLHPIGIPQLDNSLGGGLPLGSICELTGPDGSGRTSIALSLLSSASTEGVCAYIDVSGTLSPQSAAAVGVDLANLLWVHFAASGKQSRTQSPHPASSRTFEVKYASHRPIHGGCGNSHPRGETKGLAPALEQMLFDKGERRKRKMEGTPGHPNQPLGLHTASQDQVEWERFNLRKVDETDPLRQMDRQAADAARLRAAQVLAVRAAREQKPVNRFDRLNRALRATDQVLQSGGFRVVVLDLASLDPQEALRIPSATWFRNRRAAQESNAILLLLTRVPCAGSSAACVLECSAGALPSIQGVLTAASYSTEIAPQRTGPAHGKKASGRATCWDATPMWMRAAGR